MLHFFMISTEFAAAMRLKLSKRSVRCLAEAERVLVGLNLATVLVSARTSVICGCSHKRGKDTGVTNCWSLQQDWLVSQELTAAAV